MDALRLLLILSIISSSFAVNKGGKVSLELYYETLCPACSNLMANYLYKLVHSDLISIADLKLIPYGNARVNPNGTITCQDYPNFVSYICKAYKGTTRPLACTESSINGVIRKVKRSTLSMDTEHPSQSCWGQCKLYYHGFSITK